MSAAWSKSLRHGAQTTPTLAAERNCALCSMPMRRQSLRTGVRDQRGHRANRSTARRRPRAGLPHQPTGPPHRTVRNNRGLTRLPRTAGGMQGRRLGEQSRDRCRRKRGGEEESLPAIATESARFGRLFLRLDALGDDRDVECVGHVDDRCHDRRVVSVRERADERAVDLQRSSWCASSLGAMLTLTVGAFASRLDARHAAASRQA